MTKYRVVQTTQIDTRKISIVRKTYPSKALALDAADEGNKNKPFSFWFGLNGMTAENTIFEVEEVVE